MALRLGHLAAVGLLLSIVGCKTQEVTAPGARALEWGLDKTKLEEVKKGKLGEKKSKPIRITLAPPDKQGGTVAFKLALEVAPIDIVQLNRTQFLKTPTSITAEVASNTGYVVSGRCEEDPAYQMPTTLPGGELITPTAMYVDCSLTLKRGENATYGTRLRIFGDGNVTYDGNYDTGVVITADG